MTAEKIDVTRQEQDEKRQRVAALTARKQQEAPPGRQASFEEAKDKAFRELDDVLHKLAK